MYLNMNTVTCFATCANKICTFTVYGVVVLFLVFNLFNVIQFVVKFIIDYKSYGIIFTHQLLYWGCFSSPFSDIRVL